MTKSNEFKNNRVLVIDDNVDIHHDFQDILVSRYEPEDFKSMEMELFGDRAPRSSVPKFRVDSAHQGKEGFAMAKEALERGEPYAVAFVDMRMPPGWDGLQTIDHLWQVDEQLEVVICTAYSDYSWEKIVHRTGENLDKLLILKKPFDAIEVQQIVTALARKWQLGRQAALVQEELEGLVEKRTFELRKAEETARHARERWRSLLDNAPNLIMVVSRQGEVEFVNHSVAGDGSEGGSGRDFFDFIDSGHRFKIDNSIQKIFQHGETPGCIIKGVDKDGNDAWYEVQFGTIKEDGVIVSATLIATDITERRDIEAQLLQSQKLEAIGRLAGGIAHDINNILGVIMGSASVLEMETHHDDERSQDIRIIMSACRKGGRTARDLLDFARKGNCLKEKVSFNQAVIRIVELLKHTISKKIVLRVELDERVHYVMGDLGQIDNALMNICINALDAMGKEGELTIRTESVFVEGASDDSGAADLPPGHYVKLRVKDTGSGMDEETKSRAFEPFFTTKALGEGTGLGLSMMYGVVKNHGGIVNIESDCGKGTVVEILFPCIDQIASELPDPPVKTPSVIPKRGGLLVVDDEELLLISTKRILSKMGYRVFMANNGRDALDQFVAHKNKIDVVLLDMMMPDLDGYDTFFELRKIDPKVKVLLCSGYSKDEQVKELLENGALGFVHKPFDVTILTRKLESVFLS